MPGVYLIVSNFDNPEQQAVLRNTSGGYPHVTLFHTSTPVRKGDLIDLGARALHMQLGTELQLFPENVKINSFYHEKSQCKRYDVLMYLESTGFITIENLRDRLAGPNTPEHICKAMISMNEPHVTHSIHWSEKDAKIALDALKTLLPITVEITGFTL